VAYHANRIVENQGGGRGVGEIDDEGSRLRGRGKDGGESPDFSTTNAALVFNSPYEWYNSVESVPKKEIPV
jgi:hypothetical protein